MVGRDIALCGKLRMPDEKTLRMRVRLSPEYERLVHAGIGPRKLLGEIINVGLHAEAVRFISHALPPREAVWWSCMCVAHTAADMLDAEKRAVVAAEAWVRRPDGEARRQAAFAAALAGYTLPGAWPALAAYWNRTIAPRDPRTGRGVEGAVMRASQRGNPEHAMQRFQRFFTSAHDIASGGTGNLPPETPITIEERRWPS